MGHKLYVADLAMGTCSLALLIIFSYVTYRVGKIIRATDKVLFSMLFMLDLTLLSIYPLK